MGGSPSSELDGFSAALAALAARAAEWIYEPDPRQRPLPWVLTLGEQTVHLRYKQRQLLNRDGTNSVRKATFVATLELSGERKRVFVLAFQGTSSDKDWLTNLGVERNRRAFARLGLAVHSGWAATIDSDFHFSAMKAGLEEEAKSEGGIDAVLLCGHSLGGAIAQIAAMFLYNEALADENLQKWTQCLHCYTFGAPTPFSLPEEAELQAEAKAALEWMQEKCLNFVNNNDPVPRLPGNLQFAQRFLQKSPLFALADFFTNIAARAQKVQEEGYLQTYQPVVSTQLVGHARPREGVRVKAGAAGAAKLSEEQRADPAAGRCSEVNVAADHPVRTYVNKVYRSVHVADHLYGQEDALVWQEVPLENGSYRGQVSRGKLSGAGVAKWADDSRYEGQWQEGSMQGLGAFTKPDGSCYQGQWAAGKMHGRGVLTSPDGHRFEGEWRDGEQL